MNKFCLLLLILIMPLTFTSCEYQDLDKTLFITAIVIDKGEQEGTMNIYYEAYRPSASSAQEKAEGERIIYGVKDADIMEASDKLNELSNLSVSYSQTKTLLFTRAAAEQGLDLYVNLWNHSTDFTIRTYLGIWDAEPEEIENIELKGEQFLGVYLRTHINNSEKNTSHVNVVTMLDLMNAAAIKDKVITLPIIRPIKQEKTQLIDLPGVALIRNYKMAGELPAARTSFLLYMNNTIKKDFIATENPDAKGTDVVLITMSSDVDTIIKPQNERMIITKNVNSSTLLRGSQKTFVVDDWSINTIEKNMNEEFEKNCLALYKEYASQGLDIYNLGESIYREYPWFDQKDLFKKIDFKVKADFKIDGTNYKFDFNTTIKHKKPNR